MKASPYEWAYLFPQGEYIFVSTNEEMKSNDDAPEEIVSLLQDQGYKTVIGADAVRAAIAAESDGSTEALCSGYGVLPDGTKCGGCKDCNNDNKEKGQP